MLLYLEAVDIFLGIHLLLPRKSRDIPKFITTSGETDDIKDIIKKIKYSKHIRKAVFVFDDKTLFFFSLIIVF
jgi:hypothetical protein